MWWMAVTDRTMAAVMSDGLHAERCLEQTAAGRGGAAVSWGLRELLVWATRRIVLRQAEATQRCPEDSMSYEAHVNG